MSQLLQEDIILQETLDDPGETFWRSHYNWLKDRGYQLRPRYSPGWTPSWKGTKKNYMDCEDGYNLIYSQINDATTTDGSRVALKQIDSSWHPFEEDITRKFSTKPLSGDPKNHCVPLFDVLEPPVLEGGVNVRIIVIPFLRVVDNPVFDTVGEVIDCVEQLFEGVTFMHRNHTAHRDLSFNNFMMESTAMYPDGYHSQRPNRKLDATGKAKFYTRTQRPPRYYLIDFGLSRQYSADETSPSEAIIIGADPSVPEFQSNSLHHNPYHTDVYLAGNIVRQLFLDGHPFITTMRGYTGLEFLRPLIDDMVQDDPLKRPNMDEVMQRFEAIITTLSTWKLRSRTSSRRANIIKDTVHMLGHWRRKLLFMVTKTPAVPKHS